MQLKKQVMTFMGFRKAAPLSAPTGSLGSEKSGINPLSASVTLI